MIDIYEVCSKYGISKNEIESLQIHSAIDISKIYETSLRTRFNEEFKENIKRINKNLISIINSANSINHFNIHILNKNIGDNSDILMDRIIKFYKDLGFEVKAPKENRSVNSTMIIEWPEVNIEEILKPIDDKVENNTDKFE